MSTFTQFIGGRLQSQTFNSSGTFTAPASVNNVWISLSGGGGGSGSTPNGEYCTGGGAGAWCSKVPVAVTPASNYTVTVGGASGTSSFGNLISRGGGGSGAAIQNGNSPVYGGGGGANSGGYTPGNASLSAPASSAGGQAGGSSGGGGFFGNSTNSGSGGGAAQGYNPSSGFSGKVIVEWIA